MTDNEKKSNAKIDEALEKLKGRINPTEEQLSKLKEMAEKCKGKSEEDIFFEIIKLKNKMVENMDEEEYKKKLKKLEKIRPMLNEEQNKKLDKLLESLRD